jgi:hypothetical protein
VPLHPGFVALLAAILVLYVASAEVAKRVFYRQMTRLRILS